MQIRRAACAALLLLPAFALLKPQADAATFSVSPTRLELNAKHRTSILTFTNSAQRPLRMQVRTMSWSMASDGAWQLAPSDDLIATPELLEIAPGRSMQLRIGCLAQAGAKEASYRLLIDELPNLDEDTAPHGPEIKVLTQVSLPVYLEPSQATRVPLLRAASIEHGELVLAIADAGTQRLDAQNIQLTLTGAAGQPLGHHQQVADYVLAGRTGYVRTKIPPSECTQAGAVTLSWPAMQGVTSSYPISKGGGACWSASLH